MMLCDPRDLKTDLLSELHLRNHVAVYLRCWQVFLPLIIQTEEAKMHLIL